MTGAAMLVTPTHAGASRDHGPAHPAETSRSRRGEFPDIFFFENRAMRTCHLPLSTGWSLDNSFSICNSCDNIAPFMFISTINIPPAIKLRSLYIMGFGTLLVLVFSDPAVGVLNEIGKRTGIPSFYISFVLAPLASNASELVATYNYSSKKTLSSMTIGLATLEGAACRRTGDVVAV